MFSLNCCCFRCGGRQICNLHTFSCFHCYIGFRNRYIIRDLNRSDTVIIDYKFLSFYSVYFFCMMHLNTNLVHSNSMFVVDDERQRQKMTDEFYANYKRDIEFYQERIQHFIDNGCDSQAVIQRWMQKINSLQMKKQTYEEILQRQLDDLNSDYAMLQMQGQELAVRNVKGQTQLNIAA